MSILNFSLQSVSQSRSKQEGEEGFFIPVGILGSRGDGQPLVGSGLAVSSPRGPPRCLARSRCPVNIREYRNDRNEALQRLNCFSPPLETSEE